MTVFGNYAAYLVYGAPLLALFAWAVGRRARVAAVSTRTFREAVDAGLTQPPSLHPVIDTSRCIGCESCIHACPEFPAHQVLGLVDNKATLVSPTDCIGHGACRTVCPTGAISLVFGTAERGVDIPAVNPDFSTNVPGVYIAGELGGMGLIRNAVEQGRQAMEAIADHLQENAAHFKAASGDKVLDVIVVGAGPAGISATLGAMSRHLSHHTIEQHALGGTVANFPRGKLVMTAPAVLPLVGDVHFRETTKENLIDFWSQVARDTGMTVSYGEHLEALDVDDQVLEVTTSKGRYLARAVLLAIGRRGTPRKLGVPGEELPKVHYSLLDPADFRGQRVLVVGGGDSALEAAGSLVEEADARVTLSYRSNAFSRAKRKNRDRIDWLLNEGRIDVRFESQVHAIHERYVELQDGDDLIRLDNDAVIVCAGGILPDGFLREVGIHVETRYGT